MHQLKGTPISMAISIGKVSGAHGGTADKVRSVITNLHRKKFLRLGSPVAAPTAKIIIRSKQ